MARAEEADSSTLATLRTALGWSRMELARRLECDETSIRWMETGRRRTPAVIVDWRAKLAAFHDRNPPPEWRTKAPESFSPD